MSKDDTEDDGLYSRFTVSGYGPVVHEQEQDDVTIATKTQAQVERDVRDADDFSDVLGGRNPDHDEDAVRALIGHSDELRLPADRGDRWDFAADWTIEVEAPTEAWVALGEEEKDPSNSNRKTAADVLDILSRSEKNAGPNALHAALDLALDDYSELHTKLLERYLDRYGPSREDFEDWLADQDEDDSDA